MKARLIRGVWLAVAVLAAAALDGAIPADDPVQRQSGGLVARDGLGRMLIVNRQKRVPARTVQMKAEYLSRLLGIRVDVSENAEADATVTVALVEGPDVAVANGRRSGAVDVGTLDEADLARTFNQAFARVATGLFVPEGREMRCGRAEIEAVFAGESFTTRASEEVRRLLPEVGFAPAVVTTYRTACREGWAPEPVNDLQRAIRAEVLAEKERGPTNPILILPPGKVKRLKD